MTTNKKYTISIAEDISIEFGKEYHGYFVMNCRKSMIWFPEDELDTLLVRLMTLKHALTIMHLNDSPEEIDNTLSQILSKVSVPKPAGIDPTESVPMPEPVPAPVRPVIRNIYDLLPGVLYEAKKENGAVYLGRRADDRNGVIRLLFLNVHTHLSAYHLKTGDWTVREKYIPLTDLDPSKQYEVKLVSKTQNPLNLWDRVQIIKSEDSAILLNSKYLSNGTDYTKKYLNGELSIREVSDKY